MSEHTVCSSCRIDGTCPNDPTPPQPPNRVETPRAGMPGWEQHVRGIAAEQERWVDVVSVQLFVEELDKARADLAHLTVRLAEVEAENVELQRGRDRLLEACEWADRRTVQEGQYFYSDEIRELLEAAAPSAPAVEPEPVGDVREEWGYQAPNHIPVPQSSRRWAELSARNNGGTLYRRTVTTTPWVAAPPTPAPEDGEG